MGFSVGFSAGEESSPGPFSRSDGVFFSGPEASGAELFPLKGSRMSTRPLKLAPSSRTTLGAMMSP